jgi:hypothetical protein
LFTSAGDDDKEEGINLPSDADAAAAISFASRLGLQDVAVISRTKLAEGENEYDLSGTLSVDSQGLSVDDAKALGEFLAGGLTLRVVVRDGEVASHDWVGVQLS